MRSEHGGRRGARALAVVVAVLLASGLVPSTESPAKAEGPDRVTLVGRGYGHGRGMGQWGAYGYAVDLNRDWRWILSHFYGGTTEATIPTPAAEVLLRSRSGLETIVHLSQGALTTSVDGVLAPTAGRRAVRVRADGPTQWTVWDGPGCGGPWKLLGSVSAGQVVINPAVSPSENPADLLEVCESSGRRAYRGQLAARWFATTSDAAKQRTVNVVDLESLVRGVVPQEVSPSWGSAGAWRGMNALRAQAVAARSYAASGDARWGSATTCDDIFCQVYRGVRFTSLSGAVTTYEHPTTSTAVAETRNVVRTTGSAIARTEFSASTGGWTAGGTFPAVIDEGDATSANPHRSWTVELASDQVEAAFDSLAGRDLGELIAVEVLQRNGLGADGGRVLKVRGRFTGGQHDATGEAVRSRLGLKSDWFSVAGIPPDAKTQPAGGYVLRSDGSLAAFGAAQPLAGATTLSARGVDLAGASGTRGYVVDGFGVLHPVGGAAPVTSPVSHPGWDIVRDVVVRADGGSGYVLDGFGGVFPFGGASSVPVTFYEQADKARRLVLRSDGASGYVVTVDGHVHAFGGAPPRTGPTLPAGVVAVDLVLSPHGERGAVLGSDGIWRSFGGAPAPAGTGSAPVAADGRADGTSGYVVGTGGAVAAFGGAAPVSFTATTSARDVVAIAEPRGYVLDGWGGMHPFGGAPPAVSTAWTPGQDVMRRAVVRGDGGGYVMNAFGAVTGFGTAAVAAPPSPTGGKALWPGWDIARDLVLLDGAGAGYVLDGWGGLHPFGGAPPVRGTGYWPGWDIARRVVLLPDRSGGFVLDGWGGLHPFAVGSKPMPKVPPGGPYWGGWDIARDVVLLSASGGFVLDGWGGVHPFGDATGQGSWYGGAAHPAIAAASEGGRPWAVYLDRYGGLHSAPQAAPAITGSAYWPDGSLVRDVALAPR